MHTTCINKSTCCATGLRLYRERDTKRSENYLVWPPCLTAPQPMRNTQQMVDVIVRVGRGDLMQDVQVGAMKMICVTVTSAVAW